SPDRPAGEGHRFPPAGAERRRRSKPSAYSDLTWRLQGPQCEKGRKIRCFGSLAQLGPILQSALTPELDGKGRAPFSCYLHLRAARRIEPLAAARREAEHRRRSRARQLAGRFA